MNRFYCDLVSVRTDCILGYEVHYIVGFYWYVKLYYCYSMRSSLCYYGKYCNIERKAE